MSGNSFTTRADCDYPAIFFRGIAFLVGWIWILLDAFAESVPWGVGILFFSPLALVYAYLNWEENRGPAAMYVGGFLAYILAQILS